MTTKPAAGSRRVRAFLGGTFVVALAAALVLGGDVGDAELSPESTAAAAATDPTPRLRTAGRKSLKAARPYRLRAKKTALRKRGQPFSLDESGTSVPLSQRPRRALHRAPPTGLPVVAATLEVPDLAATRHQPGFADRHPAAPQLRAQLIRGPPPALLV